MGAVRGPPAAEIQSQSTHTVLSPNPGRTVPDRRERPINLWISKVRPLPRPDSLGVRVLVERGSIEYSAVTHPLPVFLKKGGTLSSKLAEQITFVSPISMRTDPSACFI